MSEAVLDDAIEHIADGLTVDWNAFENAAPGRDWAKSLRVLNDIVKLHREAAVDYEQTTLTHAPGEASAAAPDQWGKYRLANKVGEGSYGSVYRAWDSELERDVAIKILHRRVGDTRLKERLLQEGRALAKIRHNNVVNVLGMEAHGDRVGLCMEFVRGKTLADIVHGQGKMSAAEAVLIGEDLCRALSAVHRAGYIHRDVKAKNVMRDDSGRIVLMDFGTGRAAEAQGKNDRAGTPLYMAPEVIGDGQASARSDVYSLGVLLYHLVTGDYPVNARTIDELRDAHANRRHRWLSELRPDLPVAFMQVVEKSIALDPDERYANASELLAALTALKLGARSRVRQFAKPIIAVATVITGMVGLGLLTSMWFNLMLARGEFVSEGLSDWLLWGRRTSVPPLILSLMVLVPASALLVLRRLIVTISARARGVDEQLRRDIRAAVHRLRLDEAQIVGSCALLLSASILAVAIWVYWPLLLSLWALPVQTASTEELRLLSPAFLPLHNEYRVRFSLLVLFSVVAWLPAIRLVRKGQVIHPGVVAGGVAVLCLALALLHFPYRLFYFNDEFVAVDWRGARCYLVGDRVDTELLFCPTLEPPRNRIVPKDSPGLVPLGITENIFARFGGETGDESNAVSRQK